MLLFTNTLIGLTGVRSNGVHLVINFNQFGVFKSILYSVNLFENVNTLVYLSCREDEY